MGLLETAAATLIGGERRIDTAARNVTNANTPGYKREVSYAQVTQSTDEPQNFVRLIPEISTTPLNRQGALVETGNPLDLAINGSGMFLLREGNGFVLSRGGQFTIGNGGTLIDANGRILQQAGGGDLVLSSSRPTILTDGTVLDGDVPIGAVAMYEHQAADSRTGTAIEPDFLVEAESSEIHQGMFERSNVVLSDEMIELMRTQRQVESGAQLVRTYDQLMAQAISTFSRSGS